MIVRALNDISFYKFLHKTLFRCISPINRHRLALWMLKNCPPLPQPEIPDNLKTKVFDLDFHSPICLAAGLDKDGVCGDSLERMGFGAIEYGTVTSSPSAGHRNKSIHLLQDEEGVLNFLGLPSAGVGQVSRNLYSRRNFDSYCITGGSLQARDDGGNETFCEMVSSLCPHVHYFTLNLSCPNFSEVSMLYQSAPIIRNFVDAVKQEAEDSPAIIKIPHDISRMALDDLVFVCQKSGADGVILGNSLRYHKFSRFGAGALSGRPIFSKCLEAVSHISGATGGQFPIIACGGVSTGREAYQMLNAGASLVQIYSAIIYSGFGVVKRINDELSDLISSEM